MKQSDRISFGQAVFMKQSDRDLWGHATSV